MLTSFLDVLSYSPFHLVNLCELSLSNHSHERSHFEVIYWHLLYILIEDLKDFFSYPNCLIILCFSIFVAIDAVQHPPTFKELEISVS